LDFLINKKPGSNQVFYLCLKNDRVNFIAEIIIVRIIWKIIFNKMKATASNPKWVKRGQGINIKRIIKNQTFFKSRQEGAIIAPIFKNRNTITMFFHSVILICFINFKKSFKKNCQLENWGIIYWFARKYLLTKNSTASPPNIGAIDINRLPTRGNLELE